MSNIDKIKVGGVDYEIVDAQSRQDIEALKASDKVVGITQAEYDKLGDDVKDDTLYVITDAEGVEVSDFATKDELSEKQDKMSGNYLSKVDVGGSSISIETKAFADESVQKTDTVNFKTINGNAIFGTGDIKIEGGGSSVDAYTKAESDDKFALKDDTPFTWVYDGNLSFLSNERSFIFSNATTEEFCERVKPNDLIKDDGGIYHILDFKKSEQKFVYIKTGTFRLSSFPTRGNIFYENLRSQATPLALVNTTSYGYMSPSDKIKLDSIPSFWSGTKTEYDNISNKDANTIYLIHD